MVSEDSWLSQYLLPVKAFRYDFDESNENKLPAGFLYTKISVNDLDKLNHLLSKGFYIVETAFLFVQKQLKDLDPNPNFVFRDVKEADINGVLEISQNAFTHARFYQDPLFDSNTASIIKREWVNNYFKGSRGTRLIVSESADGNIAGFLMLINDTIDLIATSPRYYGKGVASGLIEYANRDIGFLKAGTQSTNVQSINLYRKMNFVVESASFTLHKHSAKG